MNGENIDDLLLVSVARGDQKRIAELIAAGADPSHTDAGGNNAFHYVCLTGDIETAMFLCNNCCKEKVFLGLSCRNSSGRIPEQYISVRSKNVNRILAQYHIAAEKKRHGVRRSAGSCRER